MYHVEFPGLGLSFEVNRVLFQIGGYAIYWYGALIAFGMFLAMVFAFRKTKEFGINVDPFIDVIMIGFLGAIICARAYFVAFSSIHYETFWDLINLRDGGIAIYGAIIGAVLFGMLACKWRKVPIAPTLDLAAMGFFIGQAVGRWGNFVNQEAFGANTTLPWGMYSERTNAYLRAMQGNLAQNGIMVDPNLPVHPTFLYESLWCALGFILLYSFIKKRRYDGQIALMYVAWYGAGRFIIEGLRTDSLYIGPLRVSQLLAAVSVLVALSVLYKFKKTGREGLMRDKVNAPQQEQVVKGDANG
ncbi:prolipoprotein diacylglyceryl transferase [Ruminococcaceae bacterium OttesenSCG-928-N02]|nr:prolipoprotein diacylglyceryl transferase [Ruminococcaceae bacterium OttesenSCG-928-N02]